MRQEEQPMAKLWSWLLGVASGKASHIYIQSCPHERRQFPTLRYFPAQYPAPVISNEPGHVLVYCRDLNVGACLAEAVSRYGRSVYICNDFDETLDLAQSAPKAFYCLLFAEDFPGGEMDIGQMLKEYRWVSGLRWACIDATAPSLLCSAELIGRDARIALFEQSFMHLCRSSQVGLCPVHPADTKNA